MGPRVSSSCGKTHQRKVFACFVFCVSQAVLPAFSPPQNVDRGTHCSAQSPAGKTPQAWLPLLSLVQRLSCQAVLQDSLHSHSRPAPWLLAVYLPLARGSGKEAVPGRAVSHAPRRRTCCLTEGWNARSSGQGRPLVIVDHVCFSQLTCIIASEIRAPQVPQQHLVLVVPESLLQGLRVQGLLLPEALAVLWHRGRLLCLWSA